MELSIQSFKAALGAAPVLFEITAPSLNKNKAGIPLTPSWDGEFGFSSTSSLNNNIFIWYYLATKLRKFNANRSKYRPKRN